LVVANVLIHEPDNADASALRSKVDQCLAPAATPPAPAGPRLAQAEPPEQGGLPVKPGELETDYRKRVAVMRVRYDEAIAALGTAANPDAIAQLESLLAETSSQYLDVAARLADAKRAMAKLRQREAQDLERKDAYDEAIAKLNEAKAFDPSQSKAFDSEVSRIQKTKITRGEDACQLAKLDINYKRNEAIENFRRVVRWLPTDHECYALARKYVPAK
jgi:tetratricopeptide (TPR) repeat protein